MDKADKILEAEREKSRQIIKSRRTALRPIAILLFLMLVGAGFWVASDIAVQVDREGLWLLFVALTLIVVTLYLLLHFFEGKKLISMLIRMGAVLVIGYTITLFF